MAARTGQEYITALRQRAAEVYIGAKGSYWSTISGSQYWSGVHDHGRRPFGKEEEQCQHVPDRNT